MVKIYPQQWRQIHPFVTPLSTDQYYAQLASRVAEILKRSLLNEAFETTEDLTELRFGLRLGLRILFPTSAFGGR